MSMVGIGRRDFERTMSSVVAINFLRAFKNGTNVLLT